MKTRRAECLLFVAIATSAIVMQIREHTLPTSDANLPAQAQADQSTARMQSCEPANTGMLRAACETQGTQGTRDERKPVDDSARLINRNDTPRAPTLWV